MELSSSEIVQRFRRHLAVTPILFFSIAVINICQPLRALADVPVELDSEILGADIEKLLSIEVTSFSRVPEEKRRIPAAVTVVTNEDIRRSGARSVPEALRLVPGVAVARIDANKWAVSIRGFHGQYANKLLVMIDGRSIYNPLLSGTFWESKDVLLDDVDRIEVIRGPGGSTWGSNAVNGVINVITKNAKDTQGGLIVAGGGSEERGFGDLRYGTALDEDTFMRVYGKGYKRDNGYLPSGSGDDSERLMGGFRLDSGSKDNLFTLQGSVDDGEHDGITVQNDVEQSDYVVQSQWQRNFTKDSSLIVSGYFARTEYDFQFIGDDRNTTELNAQYSFVPAEHFQLLTGAQYRNSSDNIANSTQLQMDPTSRTTQLVSAFSKLKYDIIPDEVQLSVGARVEHTEFADIEVEPDATISWTPNDDQTLWASVSRAVRTPSRLENDFRIPVPGTDIVLLANKDLESENLLSYQLGFRQTLSSRFYLDVAAFYNEYTDLIFAQGITLGNSVRGSVYGVEIAPSLKIADKSILSAGYSLLLADIDPTPSNRADPGSVAGAKGTEESAPQHQAFGKASLSIAEDWSFDCDLRYVSRLASVDIPAYVVGDARIAWQAQKALELSVVGQNLFNAHHIEQTRSSSSEVQQGIYGMARFTF